MLIWYFLTVPDLPWEAIDQTKSVTIIKYSVSEGASVNAGDTIAEVETWWARLKIVAKYPCMVEKRLFDSSALRGIQLEIGQPIALAWCDYVDAPLEKTTTQAEVVHFIREKPKKSY